MSAVDLRTEIVQMIEREQDTSILEAIRTLLHKLRHTDEGDQGLSDEEVEELDTQRAERISGKVEFLSEEESIRMIRSGSQE